MAPETVIDVHELSVRYGNFTAVNDLSFNVQRGELYALLGTNGAGKSSTLEVIEGHRAASAGEVRVFGEPPTRRRSVRPRTGIMLQESGFAADLTVLETVGLIGSLTRRDDRPARVLDIVGLRQKASTRVSQLSGGEKRRLDFATALYGSPELLFLDEPTTGLDIQSRDALWESVDRLREDETTVVLTTHYLEEAQQRADRVGLMHRGEFRMQGTIAELTRTLPARISFKAAVESTEVPLEHSRLPGGKVLVETRALQTDLHQLLAWADQREIELVELEAGPTRLDDVFRSLAHD